MLLDAVRVRAVESNGFGVAYIAGKKQPGDGI
jgi:hypothetical protein